MEDCPEFKGLNVDKWAQRAKENLLCFCCLNSNEHQARQCSERRSCGVDNCPEHHHPLIHGAAPVFVGAAVAGCISPAVLLPIVPLVGQTPKGTNMHTYAPLDSESQASLILERLAKELGLDGPRDVLTLGNINSKREFKPSRKLSIAVKATSSDNMVAHCTQSWKPGPFSAEPTCAKNYSFRVVDLITCSGLRDA